MRKYRDSGTHTVIDQEFVGGSRSVSKSSDEFLAWCMAGNTPDPDPNDTPASRAAAVISAIRAERDRRLAATDYQAMPDYPAPPVGLAAYRQALRDFPATVDVAALSLPLDVAALNWPKSQ